MSVDSDVIVDRDAIRQLVRRFSDPRIAAVGGWVDVRNKHDNWLTRMQVLKYWFAYYVVKNVERAVRQVLSVSGCLAAYRSLGRISSCCPCSGIASSSGCRSNTARIAFSPARS